MRCALAILCGIVIAACTSTTSPAVTILPGCTQAFQEAADLQQRATTIKDVKTAQLKVIEAGGIFLNNCTDLRKPLNTQAERLQELKRLAQMMPSGCWALYKPTIQFIDVDHNGSDELILHTQTSRCDTAPMPRFDYLGAGGLSIAYYFNASTQRWQGTMIWPCPDVDSLNCPSWNSAWTQSPEPKVIPLRIHDSEGHAYMLVVGANIGADHDAKVLVLWRWVNDAAETALEIRLTNWCGNFDTWDKWEVTQEGNLLIPAAKATPRCPERKATVYVLKDDRFVEENQ